MAELNIESYKASGIYFIETYNNRNYNFPLVTGRLVIGSSKNGLINAAMSLNSTNDVNRTYGDDDITLESKGSFFHQTLKTALLEGPVYGLNVLPVDLLNDKDSYKNKDRSNFTIFNTEPAISTGGDLFSDVTYEKVYSKDAPIKDFYNRQRFWLASDEKLTDVKNKIYDSNIASNSLISLVNLSKKDITVFIKKADLLGYDITVQEWYSLKYKNAIIPSFLHPDDLISDYFVDVIVIEGNWTNYSQLSRDPIYGNYFDKNGLIVEKINNFLISNSVKIITRVTGSLIPDLTDNNGNNISIDRLFNNKYALTELILGLDKEKINSINLSESEYNSDTSSVSSQRIDLVGHGLYEKDTNNDTSDYNTIDDGTNMAIDLLSYKYAASNLFKYDIESVTNLNNVSLGNVVYITGSTNKIYVYQNSKLYKAWKKGLIVDGCELKDANFEEPTTTTYLKIEGEYTTTGNNPIKYITIKAYTDVTLQTETSFTTSNTDFVTNETIFIYNDKIENITKKIEINKPFFYENGVLKVIKSNMTNEQLSDFLNYVKPGNYLLANTSNSRRRLLKIESVNKRQELPSISTPTLTNTITDDGNLADGTYYYVISAYDEQYWTQISDPITVDVSKNGTGKVTLTWSAPGTGNYKYKIYRGTASGTYDKVKEVTDTSFIDDGNTFDTFTGDIPSPPYDVYYINTQISYSSETNSINIDVNNDGNNNSILVQKSIFDYVPTISGVLLPKFVIREQLLPNGTAQRQEELIKFIFDSGLANAISDTETLDVKYIIDTYKGEITSSSKFYWGLIAAKHSKALAFVNDPSMKQFEKHTDPSFIETTTGLINTEYIVNGGNSSLNPSYLYQLPSYLYNGTPIETYMYFIGPEVLIRRNNKVLSVPPAVYASNVYMRRNKSSNKYGIPAAKNGIISEPNVVGLEYSFNNKERGLFETNGHNVIIRKRRVGTFIFTDNTAYYKIKSPLNSATNRDILITIEKGIDLLLFNYLYDYNTSITQIRVTLAIEQYLNGIIASGGIASASVTFDDSNNTNDIKSANIGLIDIVIGFEDGIHKFINRVSFSESDSGTSIDTTGFQLY